MDRIPDLPGEEWRPIEGYGGKYLCSNLGRIKSLKHANAKILTPFMNNKGYDRVCLSRFGKARHFLVSRLVAQAWCPNPDPEICNTVDHIDGDTSNNRADNLRWMSQQDNYKAYCEGRRKMMDNRTVFEKMRGTRIPDYYDGMYKDGYQPWEIIEAAHKSIIKEYEARQTAAAAETPDAPMNVHFQVEVKKK